MFLDDVKTQKTGFLVVITFNRQKSTTIPERVPTHHGNAEPIAH
jgi:hypothetical protein